MTPAQEEKLRKIQGYIASSERSLALMRTDRQRLVLELKGENASEQEIANVLGITKQRVHQLAHGL